ncbi:MAG: protein kinase [Deltaproteobacteria bacterium]|nr:protein kinase [Deltaproteobacteria bacterium]
MSEPGDARLASGKRMGPYRIEELLGEGAMGRVYRAVHESLGREVAIKALKPAAAAEPTLVERFLAEARAVNLIRHENIVECEGLVQDADGAYIVMELLAGQTLGAALHASGRFPPERAVAIVLQIADALAAAHDKGIVHRDLKPENVFLIRRAGSDDYVKVLDFGIARLRPDLGQIAATQSGTLVGTPAYMAPEQARGERASAQSDVYALGVVLFQLVTGRLPLSGATMPLMFVATLNQRPPRADAVVPVLAPALAEVIDRTLAKEPGARPPGMAALRRELETALGLAAQGSQATPPRRPTDSAVDGLAPTLLPSATGARSRGRRPLAWAAAGAVVVAALAALMLGWGRARRGGSGGVPTPLAAGASDATVPRDAAPLDATALDAAGPAPVVAPSAGADDDGPDASNARAAIRARYVQGLNVCWELAHKLAPRLPRLARVTVRLSVGSSGRVTSPQVLRIALPATAADAFTEMVKDEVTLCLRRSMELWRFPQPAAPFEVETSADLRSR